MLVREIGSCVVWLETQTDEPITLIELFEPMNRSNRLNLL